ncbi:MAG: hypothetical protein RR101_04245 [Burkholderiaceae bacterium]
MKRQHWIAVIAVATAMAFFLFMSLLPGAWEDGAQVPAPSPSAAGG